VTIVAMEKEQCVTFMFTYGWRGQQCSDYWKRCHWITVVRSLYCCFKYFAANNMQHSYGHENAWVCCAIL